MRNTSNKTNGNKITDWIEFAQRDLHTAAVNLKEEIYYAACFFAQQAAEKILKAYILHNKNNLPKQHNILRLGELTSDKKLFTLYYDRLLFLNKFYIPTRYPDALPGSLPEGLPSKKDAVRAFAYAREIVEFVRKKLINK